MNKLLSDKNNLQRNVDFYFLGINKMIPAFIIEEIRRREELKRKPEDQPFLEIPIPEKRNSPPDEKDERGVVIIDL